MGYILTEKVFFRFRMFLDMALDVAAEEDAVQARVQSVLVGFACVTETAHSLERTFFFFFKSRLSSLSHVTYIIHWKTYVNAENHVPFFLFFNIIALSQE